MTPRDVIARALNPGGHRREKAVEAAQQAAIREGSFLGADTVEIMLLAAAPHMLIPEVLAGSKPREARNIACPSGSVLVPEEPTEAMANAYFATRDDLWPKSYRAMLAARPNGGA